MENVKGNTKSVPQFGGWDQTTGGGINYSMVFQKARDNRKKNINEVAASSVGNERELLNKSQDIPVANRKKHVDEVVASNNEVNEQEIFNKPQDHDIPLSNTRSVPQFGAWDQTTGGETNYSMVFQKARDNRKMNINEVAASSVGNEREPLNKSHDIPVANKKKHTVEVVANNTRENEQELLNKLQEHDISVSNTKCVPQFGGWDHSTGGETNYSIVFQKARANRKKNISEVPISNTKGNEKELLSKPDDILVDNSKKHDEVIASNNVENEQELLNKPLDIPVADIKKHTNEVAASNKEGNEQELLNKPHDQEIPVANNNRYVPQFGGWDQKTEGETNYSTVFQKARANRKKHFIDVPTSNSAGNVRELTKPHDPYVPIVRVEGCKLKSCAISEARWRPAYALALSCLKIIQNNMRSVPQFGAWDDKTGGETNYSVVFQQARENRKKQKNEATTSSSIGNERELLRKPQNQDVPVKKKKRLVSYLSCCIKPY